MKLTLPYPPQANHLYTIARGRKVLSTKGRQYKKAVSDICTVSRVKPLSGELAVTVRVYRPRRAGDLDNTFKVAMDSLTGYAWNDDRQIVELHGYRAEDKSNPRLEVEIKEAE